MHRIVIALIGLKTKKDKGTEDQGIRGGTEGRCCDFVGSDHLVFVMNVTL